MSAYRLRRLLVFSLAFLALMLLSPQVQAQQWEWAQSGGGTNPDLGNAIAVDALGNTYVTGSFKGTAHFDGTFLTSSAPSDVFVVKYDVFGNSCMGTSRRRD